MFKMKDNYGQALVNLLCIVTPCKYLVVVYIKYFRLNKYLFFSLEIKLN